MDPQHFHHDYPARLTRALPVLYSFPTSCHGYVTVLLPYTLQYGAHALEQSLLSWRSPELSVATRLMMGACKPLSLHTGALVQTPTATVSPEDTVSPNPLQPLAPSSSWCCLCLRAGGVIKMSCYDIDSLCFNRCEFLH